GHIWLWGDDGRGQLGNGTQNDATFIFLEPQLPVGITEATLAALGSSHSLLATVDGHVVAAGDNTSGQLGIGSSTPAFSTTFVPVSIGPLANNTWLTQDPDQDGLTTWEEYLIGTDPLNPNTNGDGIPECSERPNSARLDPDPDHDGVPSWVERVWGTDPFRADTDGDGVNDGVDCFPLDPTRWQCPVGDPNDHTPPVITLTEPTNAVPIPPE